MKKYIITLGFIGFSLVSYAQQSLISQEIKENIKIKVDAGDNTSIVVGVFDGDEVEYFSYGKTDTKTGINADENSVFEIGSISKVFTTLLLANNLVNGTMKLSDPIGSYLPKHIKTPSRKGKEITLKDLATHSSGLPRLPSNLNPTSRNQPYANYTNTHMYDFISTYELTRDIGERWEYSNYGMGLLGHLMELQSKMSYEDLIIKKITNPLGMPSTRVNLTQSMKAQLASGHNKDRKKLFEGHDMLSMVGAGGIRSTAKDLITFLKANTNLTNMGLKRAMQLAHQQAFKDEKRNREIGLGWFRNSTEDNKMIIWHGGNTVGYASFMGFEKGTNKGVVVLTNSAGNVQDIGRTLLGSKRPLGTPLKESIYTVMQDMITQRGIKTAISFYKKIKTEKSDAYNLAVTELNRLGYFYLNDGKTAIAKAIFNLNSGEFPEDSMVHNALGDWYIRQKNNTEAIAYYKKALELSPNDIEAKMSLNTLGVTTDVVVSDAVLQSYTGKYELQPNLILTVTKENKQLFVLLSGPNQSKLEVYPSSKNKFYAKIVKATLTFYYEGTTVKSVTLYQDGQEITGRKIE